MVDQLTTHCNGLLLSGLDHVTAIDVLVVIYDSCVKPITSKDVNSEHK